MSITNRKTNCVNNFSLSTARLGSGATQKQEFYSNALDALIRRLENEHNKYFKIFCMNR